MKSRDELITYIRRRVDELGYNQSSAAVAAGCDKDTLRNFFEGKSQSLRADNYIKIMALIAETKVPILGNAGAGERVYYFDDGYEYEMIDRPPESPERNVVALRVEGDSMKPVLKDGYIIFYTRDIEGVPEECIGKMCVVRLDDDSTMVKEVKRSLTTPGLFHLLSYNADPLVDQRLKWAARVLYTKYS